VGKPTGLISYTSQDTLAGKPSSVLRARTLIYPTLITIAAALFVFVLSFKFAFDARVLGTPGAPFTVSRDQHIQNEFRIRLINRSQTAQQYSISILEPDAVVAWSNQKQRGFLVVALRREEAVAEFVSVSNIVSKDYTSARSAMFRVRTAPGAGVGKPEPVTT
jgi:polyferredoxin